MRIIERVIENREIAPSDAFGKLSRPQVELIKRTVAKGATDDELKMFIQVCKGTQLNPFLKQVHFVKRWNSSEGREVGAIQVGIDGFRSIAESSGAYAGNSDPIYEGEKEINIGGKDLRKVTVPLKATVSVFKMVNGQHCEFVATARWEEYYPGPKMGFQWHIRPFLMLGKCAEALALRKAFPEAPIRHVCTRGDWTEANKRPAKARSPSSPELRRRFNRKSEPQGTRRFAETDREVRKI